LGRIHRRGITRAEHEAILAREPDPELHAFLDGENPDEQRLTEATGNEGATFKRS
jgi:hypothetical protein